MKVCIVVVVVVVVVVVCINNVTQALVQLSSLACCFCAC